MILIVLLYAVIAGTFSLAKVTVCIANPLFFVGVRMLVAGALFSGFQLMRALPGERKPYQWPTKADLVDFIQVIFFHIYLAFTCEFIALARLSSIKVTIMYTMTPFVTLILSYGIYRQTVTRRQLWGAILGFVGLFPLITQSSVVIGCESIGSALWPELVLMVAITSSAYAWFVIKRLMERGYSLITINGVSMFVGGLLSLLTWYFTTEPNEPIVTNTPLFMLLTGALIVLSNGIAYTLYGWLLKKYSLNFVSCAGFLSPIFGALFSTFFLGEKIGWQMVVAGVAVACGLYIFHYDE